MSSPPFQQRAVYRAINAVMRAIGTDGISKSRTNEQGGFAFRSIDDLYNGLSTPLVEAGLMILPRVASREATERMSTAGEAMLSVAVTVDYDFVAMEDGSIHTVRTVGEGVDSSDKATSKAMTAAYKYAVIQAFSIPTLGDSPDADATSQPIITNKPAAKPASKKAKAKAAEKAPAGSGLPKDVEDGFAARIASADTSKAINAIKTEARTACGETRDTAAYERISTLARERAKQLVSTQ